MKYSAYSLSQVLATYDGSYEQKAERVLELFDAFREAGAKYGKGYELASLGILVNINRSTDELVSEVVEAADYLKDKKGFGTFDIDKHARLMLGAMVVSDVFSGENTASGAAVASGALATVIAQQLAMYVAIMAATSSSMAASSNN